MTKATSNTNKMIAEITKRRGRLKGTSIGYRNYDARSRFSLVQLFFLIILICISLWVGFRAGESSSTRFDAQVVSVSDGDTIRVEFPNGKEETIRLLGVDTPETHHPTKPVGCYGPEAENFTRQSLDGKKIELEYDVDKIDKYGRTLAFVYLNGDRFNDMLVKDGFARVLTIAPNAKYSRELTQLQIKAQQNNLGLWGFCSNDN